MNDAVYKFKRYEDSSLEYTGIDKHTGTVIGLWDTAIDTAQLPEQYGREEPAAVSTDQQLPEEEETPVQDDYDVVDPWERLQIGDIVVHKSLGAGEVMSMDDKYIIVKFSDRESKFLYPSAFERGYLSVE